MNPVLRVTDVEFGYHPGKPVLRDISFEVSPGEVFIILGANGCGKSTLMRTILGECKPTSGRITVGGDDVASLGVKQLAQRLAMVFQDHSAPFPFTVLDVVKMGRTPHLPPFASPTKKDNVICLEALETVGLKDLAFEPYTQLSGGERQLVLIARALAQRTGVVLMDEPTSHLDYRNATTVISIHRAHPCPRAGQGRRDDHAPAGSGVLLSIARRTDEERPVLRIGPERGCADQRKPQRGLWHGYAGPDRLR